MGDASFQVVRWVLFVLGCLTVLHGPALAATYYVDATGTARAGCEKVSNCGRSACKTVRALEAHVRLSRGDTVNFCAGTYTGKDVCVDGRAGVTYQGITGNRKDVVLTLHAQRGDACFRSSKSGRGLFLIQQPHVKVKNLTASCKARYCNSFVIDKGGDNVILTNVRGTSSMSSGVHTGSISRKWGRPSDLLIENSEFDRNIFHGGKIYHCTRCEIRNSDFHNQSKEGENDGLHITNSPGIRVIGGKFYNNSEQGIDFSRTGSNGSHCEDYNAEICKGGKNDGNECSNDSFCSGGGSCERWVIENVTSYKNGSPIKTTSCAHWGIIRNNFFEDGQVRFEKCAHDIQVYGNTVYGGGIRYWSNHYGMDIQNNIFICDSDRTCSDFDFRSLETTKYGLSDNTWANNLTYNQRSADAKVIIAGMKGSKTLPRGTPSHVCKLSKRPISKPKSYRNTQLANWQRDHIFGPGTGDGDIWNRTVMFKNLKSTPSDLHVSRADRSGVIDGGMRLPNLPRDFDGTRRPQGGAMDIGADELTAVEIVLAPPERLRLVP